VVDSTAEQKRAVRARYRARRRALNGVVRAEADAAAQERFLELPAVAAARRVALYRPFDGEVDTAAIAEAFRARGRGVLYARRRADNTLAFIDARGWRARHNGLPEPEGPEVALTAADVVVVPGVAFDAEGHRVGMGGGCYDRLVAAGGPVAIGLAYELQRTERVPTDAWDQPIAVLVTEVGTYHFHNTERS